MLAKPPAVQEITQRSIENIGKCSSNRFGKDSNLLQGEWSALLRMWYLQGVYVGRTNGILGFGRPLRCLVGTQAEHAGSGMVLSSAQNFRVMSPVNGSGSLQCNVSKHAVHIVNDVMDSVPGDLAAIITFF
uniref:Uncharacterized protein n=1 Tax=Ananas comosus var. bracteatus TaxID=296719 RepID=A0A6V7P9T0_ANACO|nr:unnamed protein product [Ananas comosus var. bracteatus]